MGKFPSVIYRYYNISSFAQAIVKLQDVALQLVDVAHSALDHSQLHHVATCVDQITYYFNSVLEMTNPTIVAEEVPKAKMALLQWMEISSDMWN